MASVDKLLMKLEIVGAKALRQFTAATIAIADIETVLLLLDKRRGWPGEEQIRRLLNVEHRRQREIVDQSLTLVYQERE